LENVFQITLVPFGFYFDHYTCIICGLFGYIPQSNEYFWKNYAHHSDDSNWFKSKF
jgi:hypothetical protein